jgi:DNA-binding response OmpR family regulator
MQLLIVHRDPEMGEALVQMVKNYTRHHCLLVSSEAAAVDWARHHQRCDLLLTQLEAEGINGLALGSGLSEIFSGLQVLFFPNYNADERRLEITGSKIFPEPIVGDELLAAIENAEQRPKDASDLFQVVDVLQMCCLSRRSGALQMVREEKNGLVFLRNGTIVHAETTTARGVEALFEIVTWKQVEFAYERSVRPPLETITHAWDDILIRAVTSEREERTSRPQSA